MSEVVHIRANQEHRGVSLAVTGLLVVSIVFGYIVSYRTLPLIFGGIRPDYILVAGLTGLLIAVLILWLSDPILKRLIPSGSLVTLSVENNRIKDIHFSNRNNDQQVFDFSHPVELLNWSFKMRQFPKSGRERQIPGNWHCCAVRLIQADNELVLFSFVRPAVYSKLEDQTRYNVLDLKKLKDPKRSRFDFAPRPIVTESIVPASLIVGENGQYWLSERNRQSVGIELTSKDYRMLMTLLYSDEN